MPAAVAATVRWFQRRSSGATTAAVSGTQRNSSLYRSDLVLSQIGYPTRRADLAPQEAVDCGFKRCRVASRIVLAQPDTALQPLHMFWIEALDGNSNTTLDAGCRGSQRRAATLPLTS
ncbi:hypothetical protein [Candidatus Amarolinea aalborgensis]|uniref:hypothetical protein n=1 Tax=Candidatus Amarolinea aalborgensis TaxID=2249329 RepID=UPI003BF97997